MLISLSVIYCGFQARCLRRACRILPSYVSRVSNVSVLKSAEHVKASTLLLRRQLVLFGKILRSPADEPIRAVSLVGNTLLPATSRYVRRVGRPRREWIPSVLTEAYRICGGSSRLDQLAMNPYHWKAHVRRTVS